MYLYVVQGWVVHSIIAAIAAPGFWEAIMSRTSCHHLIQELLAVGHREVAHNVSPIQVAS